MGKANSSDSFFNMYDDSGKHPWDNVCKQHTILQSCLHWAGLSAFRCCVHSTSVSVCTLVHNLTCQWGNEDIRQHQTNFFVTSWHSCTCHRCGILTDGSTNRPVQMMTPNVSGSICSSFLEHALLNPRHADIRCKVMAYQWWSGADRSSSLWVQTEHAADVQQSVL